MTPVPCRYLSAYETQNEPCLEIGLDDTFIVFPRLVFFLLCTVGRFTLTACLPMVPVHREIQIEHTEI